MSVCSLSLSLSLSLSPSWEGWWQRRCFTSVPFVRCLPKGEKLKLKIQLKKPEMKGKKFQNVIKALVF